MKDGTMGKEKKDEKEDEKGKEQEERGDEERSLINVAPFEKLSVSLAHFSV